MLCRTCDVWELREGDLYCSWCAAELVGLPTVSPDPLRFYCDPAAISPKKEALHLVNHTNSPMEIQPKNLPSWLSNDHVPRLAAGQTGRLELDLRPERIGELPAFHRVTLSVEPGGLTRDIEVEVWQTPDISIPDPLPVFWGSGQKVNLRVVCWQALTIRNIEFDPPLLAYAGTPALQLAFGGGEIPLVVNIGDGVEPKPYRLGCQFHILGMDQPIRCDLDLLVRKPAAVRFLGPPGEERVRILAGVENDVELGLANDGEAVLVVHKVDFEGEEASPRISVVTSEDLPSIPPGQEGLLHLRMRCNDKSRPGTHWLTMRLTTSDPVPSRNTVPLPVQLIDETISHFVAIDFGTSDSAVAVFNESRQKPRNLPLEGKETKIYSNIFFLDFVPELHPPFQWEIGSEAARLGAGPVLSNRFVKAIKTKIGKPGFVQEIHFPDKPSGQKTHQLDAETIAGFILVDLLKRSQRRIRKYLTRFILCVPTRFTLRNKEILERVFRQAAKDASLVLERVQTLDESLAAGLFYLLMRGPRDEMVRGRDHYHLMILDFGGGTTDITVFSVRQSLDARGTVQAIKEVEIIGAWGDAELGGESVTEDIADLLAGRFLEAQLRRPPSRAEVERVRRRLEDEAEAAKIAVSELLRLKKQGADLGAEGFLRAIRPTVLWPNLGYLCAGTRQPRETQIRNCLTEYLGNEFTLTVSSSDFPGVTVPLREQEVVDCFNRKLVDLHDELILLLDKICVPKVDVLLLAGQSSQFPSVAEVLKDLAVRLDFVRDEEGTPLLKECVSLGAMLFGQLMEERLPFRLLGMKRHWTRLGRVRLDISAGRPVFEEMIQWGTEYGWTSPVFQLSSHHVVGQGLRLELRENLSLKDDPRTHLFGNFHLDVSGHGPQETFDCRLRIDDHGEVRADCHINGDWLEMERLQ